MTSQQGRVSDRHSSQDHVSSCQSSPASQLDHESGCQVRIMLVTISQVRQVNRVMLVDVSQIRIMSVAVSQVRIVLVPSVKSGTTGPC